MSIASQSKTVLSRNFSPSTNCPVISKSWARAWVLQASEGSNSKPLTRKLLLKHYSTIQILVINVLKLNYNDNSKFPIAVFYYTNKCPLLIYR